MFEKKFLAYVLYITLLEIRETAYKENNSRLFHLTDMLHNTPAALLDDEDAKEEYKNLLRTVEHLNIPDWLNNRMKEFKENFPEYHD
jgi:hypothetical protein